MPRRIGLAFAALTLAGFAVVNLSYWQDPAYWRRWWDTLTHLEPDYMNFAPTVRVQAERVARLPRAGVAEPSIAPDALRAAEAYAARFDSFALVVVHRGVIQTEWYGSGWSRERLTQSQSMMKTVTGLMMGLAIADGFIGGVADPVELYVPEWAGDPRGRITIEQLLQMSAGLAQYEFTLNPFPRDSAFRFLFGSDRVGVTLATPLAFPPGSRFDYNDVIAQLAGIVVERAVGRPYAQYLRERLWDPLGGDAMEVWLDREGGTAMTACCLLGRPLDWAKIGVMMKDRGRFQGRQVVPADWIERMITPSPGSAAYGYFTWIGAGLEDGALVDEFTGIEQAEPFLADDLFLLLGYGGQRVYVSRALDLVVVRLGPFAGLQPLDPAWDNAWLFNTLVRGIRPPADTVIAGAD